MRIVKLFLLVAALSSACSCSKGPEPGEAYKSGIAHYDRGEYEEALKDLKYATSKDPKYMEAYTAKGYTLIMLCRYEEALEAHKKALDLGNTGAEGYYLYGIALDKLGRREEAVEQYANSLKVEPRYWPSLNGMGYSCFYLGKLPEAIEYFSEGMRYAGPARPRIQSSRGYAYLAAGMANLAVMDFEEALKSDPGSRNFRQLYALGLSRRGRPGDSGKAEDILKALISEDGSDMTASHAYAVLGRKDEALALLKRHADVDPYLRLEARGRLEYEAYRDDPEFLAIVGG